MKKSFSTFVLFVFPAILVIEGFEKEVCWKQSLQVRNLEEFLENGKFTTCLWFVKSCKYISADICRIDENHWKKPGSKWLAYDLWEKLQISRNVPIQLKYHATKVKNNGEHKVHNYY